MDLLRFITAGSVDDGKSTLIGRLLYDSKNILVDQLEALEKSTKNRTDGSVDLALLTDGLRAEREQGITIDVAYRYFTTPRRKFIIAHCTIAYVLGYDSIGVVEPDKLRYGNQLSIVFYHLALMGKID